MTPRLPLVILAALAGTPFIAAIWYPPFAVAGWTMNGLIVCAAVLDALHTLRSDTVRIRRDADDVMNVGCDHRVTLSLQATAARPISIILDDEPPPGTLPKGLPITVVVNPGGAEATVSYQLRPVTRGASAFQDVHLAYASPWRLWHRQAIYRLPHAVRIYPDLRSLKRLELLWRRDRLSGMGFQVRARPREDGELSRLREYRRGDPKRLIDWRATAKHRTLISRELTPERCESLLVLLDCGHTTQGDHEGLSGLDRGLSAAIHLCHAALVNDDRVSFIAFADTVRTKLALAGPAASRTLVRETFDLAPSKKVSHYGLIEEQLRLARPTPSIAILITSAADPRHMGAIRTAIRPLARAHRLLCVFVGDAGLEALSRSAPASAVERFESEAAQLMLEAQEQELRGLRASGIHALLAKPNELSARTIQNYLDVRASIL